jgi:amidase
MAESSGAYCPFDFTPRAGVSSGPLSGRRFAVKDLIDVAGEVTGGGNPDWRASHTPAVFHAPVVEKLLGAGATLIARTISDELAFSLDGRNEHYGTPVNPAAPERLPGGSSSGSAVAVAGGLVDFALGTDTGGSVRVPASFCGVYGFRPSHDPTALAGVVPFAPSFDTVGWFAREGALLAQVGDVLCDRAAETPVPRRLVHAADAFALADEAVRNATMAATEQIAQALCLPLGEAITLSEDGLLTWCATYQALQGDEIRRALGPWIARVKPRFGSNIAPRFASIENVSPPDVEAAAPRRNDLRARLDAVLAEAIIVLPTAPILAPPRDIPEATLGTLYPRMLALASIASLAGLPQVSLPLAGVEGCPVGLSLIGSRGSDRALLRLAAAIPLPFSHRARPIFSSHR